MVMSNFLSREQSFHPACELYLTKKAGTLLCTRCIQAVFRFREKNPGICGLPIMD
jgi:hypothetical protein